MQFRDEPKILSTSAHQKGREGRMNRPISRRDWLKWSTLLGAGVVASACGPFLSGG